MIESIFEKMEISIDGIKKKFYGVCTGRVSTSSIPFMLGRVQVQLPFIDSVDLSPWARVASPMAGPLHGYYMIPQSRRRRESSLHSSRAIPTLPTFSAVCGVSSALRHCPRRFLKSA